MSEEVVWQDPPGVDKRGNRGPTIWQRRLAPLMARPGAWALVTSGPPTSALSGTASWVRKGFIRIPDGTQPSDWEFTTRLADGGKRRDLYARYVGSNVTALDEKRGA